MTPLAAPVSSVSERTEKQGDVVVGRCIFDLKHNLKRWIINIDLLMDCKILQLRKFEQL